MSGNEIRIKIDENNEKMQSLLSDFVLTGEIKELLAQNEKLRSICNHEFIDGVCKYCDEMEVANDE